MTWLVRMKLDAEVIRSEKIWDNYGWHKRIWQDCFPAEPEKKRDFLTRIDPLESAFQLWILGQREPQCPPWCSQNEFKLKNISSTFLNHRHYVFDIRTNPVKTIAQRGPKGEILYRPNGKRKCGKRVPLVKHKDLYAWLQRKGESRSRDQHTGKNISGGFQIVKEKPLEISPMVANHFRKKGKSGYHGGVQFRGTLEVTNHEYFKATYHAGIGAGKGFGFGLFLLAPINL